MEDYRIRGNGSNRGNRRILGEVCGNMVFNCFGVLIFRIVWDGMK